MQAGLVAIISHCGHQQRDIIFMNQEGEGGNPLLGDMISTRRSYGVILFYTDKNLPRKQS